MLYACGWQEPDSIPSNVVIRKKKNDKYDNGPAGCGAGAACYCGAYPIDGAYYSDAPLFDGADGGAAGGGDAGGCGGTYGRWMSLFWAQLHLGTGHLGPKDIQSP